MTDELELLKKDWQKKEEHLPKLSYNDIYQMIWRKSSTIVKWIFYISIAELIFWIVLSLAPFFMESYQESFGQSYGDRDQSFIVITTIFSLGVVFVFMYFLYKAYQAISVVDDVKSLMKSILKTRKIVNYYVIYNLIMAVLVTVISFYYLLTTDEKTMQLISTLKEEGSELRFWILIAILLLLGIFIMLGFIWLFYRLIYGILLKRLNKNYKELKKLEI